MTYKTRRITHKFVEHIPSVLEDGVVYVSIEFGTVVHKCCCGCGQEVVTPLSPTDWKLIYDGETISLDPSIGNWGFQCESHYWIIKNSVSWARKWSVEEIQEGREYDRLQKTMYYSNRFLEQLPRSGSTVDEGSTHPREQPDDPPDSFE